MPANKDKSVRVGLQLPTELHARIKAAADLNRRSVGDWITLAAELELIRHEGLVAQGLELRDIADDQAVRFMKEERG